MPANEPFASKTVLSYVKMINDRSRTPTQKELEKETQKIDDPITPLPGKTQPAGVMGSHSTESKLLSLLTGLLAQQKGSMKAIDVGTFTGISTLAIAEMMPEGSELISCDYDTKYTDTAERAWMDNDNPVFKKIKLQIAPAADTLENLIEAGEAGTFDIIFIDADKEGYPGYYDQAIELLRPGGVVILDNMLLSGQVADIAYTDPTSPKYNPRAAILRDLNERIAQDKRLANSVLLECGDGIVVATKRDRELLAEVKPESESIGPQPESSAPAFSRNELRRGGIPDDLRANNPKSPRVR